MTTRGSTSVRHGALPFAVECGVGAVQRHEIVFEGRTGATYAPLESSDLDLPALDTIGGVAEPVGGRVPCGLLNFALWCLARHEARRRDERARGVWASEQRASESEKRHAE